MKKKLLTTTLSLVCALAGTFALASCRKIDKPSDAHTHDYQQQYDDSEHWLQCDVTGCTEKIKDRAVHNANGDNGSCSVCGYKASGTENPPVPPVHNHAWSQVWESTDTHHWHNCTADNCTITDNSLKDGYAAHDFTDGNCVCGKPAPHSHVWSQAYESTDTHHWHNCTADNCTITDNSLKDGYAAHDFTDGNCACGKKDPSIPTEGLKYALNNDGESYSVRGIGTATDTDIVIPAEYDGKPVTNIYYEAFQSCSTITSVTIPGSVTEINGHAFSTCSNLTSVTIGNGVTEIGSCAFQLCTNLTSITIPDSVTNIDAYAFQLCSSLTSITIPNSVTNIGEGAFLDCSGLTSITIPNGVTSIKNSAFDGTGLTSITIPDGVTSIGSYAFAYCDEFTSITIPDSVTEIKDSAFFDCSKLTSITFNGTKAQWIDITKGSSWNNNTGNYTVHCTDGNIAKED